MLLSKFLVSLSARCARQNLSKLRCRLLNTQSTVVEKDNICTPSYDSFNPFAERRQEAYGEAVAKCTGKQPRPPCRINASKDSQPKCPTENAADVFKRSLAAVRHDALNLQIFTRNATNAMLGSMSADTALRAAKEWARMNQRLTDVEARLNEIVAMSLVCGTNKRHEAYAIAERINSDLKNWQYGNASGIRCMRCRLRELECRVKERTDTAVGIVRTCRGCLTAEAMLQCLETTSRDADCILRKTEEETREEIVRLEELKSRILGENEGVVEELMRRFELEVDGFAKHLDCCIAELRNLYKRCG